MSEKMTEQTRVVLVNVAIVAALIWCYFRAYPTKIILATGIFIVVFANILMYLKRRRASR